MMHKNKKSVFALLGILSLSMVIFNGCAKRVATIAEPGVVQEEVVPPVGQAGEPLPGSGGDILETRIVTPPPGVARGFVDDDANMAGSENGNGAGLDTSLGDIFFEYDKSVITVEAEKTILNNAASLKKDKNLVVKIEGHCDARGTNEYNLALGERRALAVKSYLVGLGVPTDRIKTISFGEEKPICNENNDECWSQNRRAHFSLVN